MISICLLERGREIVVGNCSDVPGEALAQTQFHTPDGHMGLHLGRYDIYINEQQNMGGSAAAWEAFHRSSG